MLELIILVISVFANSVLAVLVLAKSSQRAMNRHFVLLAATIVLWMTINYLSIHPPFGPQLLWVRLTMAGAAIMSMALVLLANIYPTGKLYYRWLPKAAITAGVVTAAVALSPWLFTELTVTNGEVQAVPGFGMAIFAPFAFGTTILSIVMLIRRYFSLKGALRQHTGLALTGIAITFSLLVFLNFVAVSLFRTTLPLVWSPLVVLIFTASFAYGIVRYRLFDVRLIIARFVGYILLVAVTGGIYGLVIVAMSYVVSGIRISLVQIISSMLVVGVLISFVRPLRRFLNRVTDVLFQQDVYDPKQVFDDMTTTMVRAIDTEELATNALTTLQRALRSEYIVLLVDDGSDIEHFVAVGSKKHPTVAHLRALQLDESINLAVVELLDDAETAWRQKALALNAAIIVRLETHGQTVGYCVFGDKASGSPYVRRDIDLIRIAADELAVAIQNTIRFEQIKEFNTTLRQRVNDATKELRASNRQLQKLDEAKDEFVSMASHQLRTPLTSVKGYISMVLEGDAGEITPMQRKLLEEAFTSSERMVHLINDFLNVSRLQTGKFMLDSRLIDLAKVVGQEVDALGPVAASRNLRLAYRPPVRLPQLYIDEGKIRQVIMNFIDNAIYYSREHTTIKVTLRREDGDMVLEVHDTGIGVPVAEQAHLFTKFFRATNARKQRPDGTGVGLFLAKKVITAHGGSMVFSSVEGEGSIFGFRLPIKKLLEAPARSADELEQQPTNS